MDRRMLEAPKMIPRVQTNKKLHSDGMMGISTIKSKPTPTRWVTTNWRAMPKKLSRCPEACEPASGCPVWGSPGNLTEDQWGLITGLPQDWGTDPPAVEGTNKILHAPRPRGEEQ